MIEEKESKLPAMPSRVQMVAALGLGENITISHNLDIGEFLSCDGGVGLSTPEVINVAQRRVRNSLTQTRRLVEAKIDSRYKVRVGTFTNSDSDIVVVGIITRIE